MTISYMQARLEREARQAFEKLWARVFWRSLLKWGKSADLAFLSDAEQQTIMLNRSARGIQQICLSQITGSVSENRNFDANFNPRNYASHDRWVRLYIGFIQGAPIPPITVYRICDTYYIEDGHHRVSVARMLGIDTLEAHVIEIQTGCCAA